MNYMKSILFFDIDGTLCDDRGHIPNSTYDALKKAHAHGHLLFINSGRSRAYINDPALFDINWDGIVSGGGTMIELKPPASDSCSSDYHQNHILSYHEVDSVTALQTVLTLKQHHILSILEGRDWLYIDADEFGNDAYIQHVLKSIGTAHRSISGYWDRWTFSKLACDLREAKDIEEGCRTLQQHYDTLAHSSTVVEFVPHGFSKGTGIRRVCETLRISPHQTFSFGDSTNDVSMFQASACAVVMGNGTDTAKQHADFVTAPLQEDGIAHALNHFDLI